MVDVKMGIRNKYLYCNKIQENFKFIIYQVQNRLQHTYVNNERLSPPIAIDKIKIWMTKKEDENNGYTSVMNGRNVLCILFLLSSSIFYYKYSCSLYGNPS